MEDDSINDPDVDKLGKGKEHAAEDFEGELQVSASAFEALERDFQEVLSDLIVDESLEKFRLEYEKLHRALKKSHEQEKRLVKKCRELNSEILNNQAKIKTALRLSQEDQKTITHLQKEMEKTWKLVYMTQEKETRAKETIGQLKEEMVNLSKLVERGAGLSINQENLVKELKQAKEELQRQVDEQAAAINVIETQLHTQHKVQEELRGERDEALRNITDLRERLTSKESDNLREVKRREKTQKELQDARARLDDKSKLEEGLSADIAAGKAAVVDLERQLSDVKATMDKHLKDYESLHGRSSKVSEDLADQVERNRKLLANYNELEVEMKKKSIEVLRLKDNVAAVTIKYEREREVVKTLKEDLAKTETPLLLAQNEIENLKKELLNAHRHEVQLTKATTKVEREKEVQLKATERAEARTKEQQDAFIEKEREATSLATEMQAHVDENRRLRKAIAQLDSDRERLGNEVGEQRNKYIECEDKLKLREIEMSELNKVIIEGKNKEKHQQQLYEAVRADRNHYSKGLLESQDEIAELKKKFKILGHQIEQLKEEISLKDQAIVKEHGDFQKAEKKSEINKKELSAQTALVKTCHELIHQQENELKNLTSIVRRMDEEALAQRKEYDQVINERDILGTQLIRRNDELALLYEKLRIQQSALKKGEVQYAARLDDIRVLKLKLKEFIRENSLNKGSGLVIEDLKREILQFQRELLQEKTKVTALSEELENPMNVHRWRKLEGSDPATFELIQKIQTLQRRLISKTEEVVEKGLIIQEKEKLYNELKGILARQPGPEVAEQLAVYQQNLKKKTAQMKAMASELNMCQAQVNEFKYEQERLLRELTEMKRKYYQQKRKDKLVEELEYEGAAAAVSGSGMIQMSRTDPSSLQNEQIQAAKNARVRYTGGGYAIR